MKISIVCLKDVWKTVLLFSDLVHVATVSWVNCKSAVSKTPSKEKWFAQDGVPKKKIALGMVKTILCLRSSSWNMKGENNKALF